jgi:hypothetical protein
LQVCNKKSLIENEMGKEVLEKYSFDGAEFPAVVGCIETAIIALSILHLITLAFCIESSVFSSVSMSLLAYIKVCTLGDCSEHCCIF